jgi:predicted nucleic acid-binding protein
MPEAITNTSPLLYLHRIGVLDWLPHLLSDISVPDAVVQELQQGQLKGYDVPNLNNYSWLHVVKPLMIPSEWLALDLGAGELAAMMLGLENPHKIILLDDALARRIAQAAGLTVWGTLKILLEAKSQGLTDSIKPLVKRLQQSGMWISEEIYQRILALADENP